MFFCSFRLTQVLAASLFAMFICVMAQSGSAEVVNKYSPWFIDTEIPHVFVLSGEIDGRTALNFERAVGEFGVPKLLMLSSGGGLVNDALLVARRAHELGVNTLVPADSFCYSACSLIFLAGKVRVDDGRLGVHQISSSSGDLLLGQVAISDILDVLGQFNVPNELMVDMFRTPPDQIYIVTDEERLKFGFYLRTEAERTSGTGPSIEERAANFLIDINRIWSGDNNAAIEGVAPFYPESLQYFGKTKSKADVMDDKRSFAVRWPIRSYSVDGSTISTACAANICHVSGNVSWHAESPERGKKSDGLAFEEFVLSFSGALVSISEEDGKVLKRN